MNGEAPGNGFGWTLIVVGLAIAGFGLLWIAVPGVSRLGRLPGDIAIERKNGRFYFPIVTCIVVSIVLSLAVRLLSWLSR